MTTNVGTIDRILRALLGGVTVSGVLQQLVGIFSAAVQARR